jgi:hypothetical protein
VDTIEAYMKSSIVYSPVTDYHTMSINMIVHIIIHVNTSSFHCNFTTKSIFLFYLKVRRCVLGLY